MSEWAYTYTVSERKRGVVVPRGSPELTEKRKNEILDACEKRYRTQGFYGVNIKEISSELSMTRPAVYNYFQTKEEILLGLLIREFSVWTDELSAVLQQMKKCIRGQLAELLADTLADKDIMLRILNMNLYEIEQNSRIERLAEFKKLYMRSIELLSDILRRYRTDISDEDCTDFCNCFNAFLIGVYPFSHHTEKQKEAMKLVGMQIVEPNIHEMVYKCLVRLIP